jgi:hypothetical protein
MAAAHDAVSIRAHFERFPATVKGAFVIRGEDPNPHQVSIKSARAVAAGGSGGRGIDLAPVVLDVPPHIDLFVPFELPVSDLESGWYGLECETDVDGIAATFPASRWFVVPWPRASTRRGTVQVGQALVGGSGTVTIDHLECATDSIKVFMIAEPPEPPALRLSADGSSLPVIEVQMDEETGKAVAAAYPLLRTHSVLHIGLGGAKEPPIDVPLP